MIAVLLVALFPVSRDKGLYTDYPEALRAFEMKIPPIQQLDELKTFVFMYVIMAPLLAALFADKIDNTFVACLLFVVLVGTSVFHLKNRMDTLEESIKEQEKRLAELEGADEEESES
jgi:hypothetical protein